MYDLYHLMMLIKYVLSPQETLLGCISEMLGNITNSTKMLEKWWMNGRDDAYSSQITTSTMLNPIHG